MKQTNRQHEESGCTDYLQHSADNCPLLTAPGVPETPTNEPKYAPHKAFDVYLNGRCFDTVFYSAQANVDAEEVRRSLINHDGYDSRIEVVAL